MSDNDCNDGFKTKSSLPVKLLIPKSRLAAMGELYVSDPVVNEGDDVYEVNLTDKDSDGCADQNNFRRFAALETWMLPDVEYAFLRCIAGNDARDVENLIAYAAKTHWLGGKIIHLNLETSKTILNRQTKFVLHNSNSQKTINYHVSNANKALKKTDFILQEWPYTSQNEPLISKDELAPWIRSRNKLHTSKSIEMLNSDPVDRHKVVSDNWQQQKQQSQQSNIFSPSPSSHQQFFMYGRPPMAHPLPFMSNFTYQLRPDNVYQRFPISFPLSPTAIPPSHYHWNPINADVPSKTVENDENAILQQSTQFHDINSAKDKNNFEAMLKSRKDTLQLPKDISILVNDECVDKIMSVFETNNKDALRRFLQLLKYIYPKKLEQFNEIMSTMDYFDSQLAPIRLTEENSNVACQQ